MVLAGDNTPFKPHTGGGGLKTATRSLHPKIALVLFRLMAHVKNCRCAYTESHIHCFQLGDEPRSLNRKI